MQVVHQLASKLRLGGVWYYTGDPVLLDEKDALLLARRGLSKPAKPGVKPKNAPKEKAPETVPPREVGDHGVVTKTDETEETTRQETPRMTKEQNRGSSGKRR